jgi:hypothetical protein
MIKFLKFSFTIINLSYIKVIDIQPDKYNIYLSDNQIKGFNFFKIGDLSSKSSKIEISKYTHLSDYNKMTNWIENLDNHHTFFTHLDILNDKF